MHVVSQHDISLTAVNYLAHKLVPRVALYAICLRYVLV
jgi:hypothetical protein